MFRSCNRNSLPVYCLLLDLNKIKIYDNNKKNNGKTRKKDRSELFINRFRSRIRNS